MLFNSFPFLLIFLPAALLLYWLADRFAPSGTGETPLRLIVLVLVSFVFYAYWDWRMLPLMLASISINWGVARVFLRLKSGLLIALAIALNLGVLAIFKYSGFFVDILNSASGGGFSRPEIVLPLGISFFSFHHIMYLVDLRAGRAPQFTFMRYALYIAFFPQVLAGPLVRWREVMHQFEPRPFAVGYADKAAQGVILLVFGLAKKVYLGDPLASYANPVFNDVAAGKAIAFLPALQGLLAFTFQIYFDFSGYTDMAIGIGLLFGILLPQNFDRPYTATSLQDFWRRWHMTLSRFLRDYLYIALGGSRSGLALQLMALLTTMALGGLWHGAGWAFVLWGVAHGLGLGIGVIWRRAGLGMPAVPACALTFSFVALCWVLFRAPSFEAAVLYYKGLFGFNGLGSGFKWRALLPGILIALVGPTSFTLCERLPRARWLAVVLAFVFVIVLLKIGDDANFEFIYFQF